MTTHITKEGLLQAIEEARTDLRGASEWDKCREWILARAAELEQSQPAQISHHEDCWRDPKHHACAVAKIERLNTHAERLSRINREVLAESELLSATVADQAAALAERDKDAERYRWLRHQSGHVWNHLVTERWLAKRSEAMDLSIDAALAASVSTQDKPK